MYHSSDREKVREYKAQEVLVFERVTLDVRLRTPISQKVILIMKGNNADSDILKWTGSLESIHTSKNSPDWPGTL